MPPQSNYDFIMNPNQVPKKSLFSGGSSLATRLLVVLGGLFVLIVVLGVGAKLLKGGGGSAFDKAAMLSVAQDQTELIRLSSEGVDGSVSQVSKNFSITAKLGVGSQQKALLTYLSSRNYKVDPKQLPLKRNAQADVQLTSATSSSSFDEVYKTIMQRDLTTYQQDLKTAYASATGSTAKTVLSSQYDAAQLLTTQLNSN